MSDGHGHDGVARHRYQVAGSAGEPYPTVSAGDHVDDLAAGYALDALDPAECAAVERHARSCPRCAGLVAAQRRAAGLLAYAAPLAQPDPAAKAELFTRIAHVKRAVAEERLPAWNSQRSLPPTLTIPASRSVPAAAPPITAPASFDRAGGPRPHRRWWTSWASAVLTVPLLVALAVTGTWAMQLRAEVDERGDRMSGLETLLEGAFGDAGSVSDIYQLSPGPAAKDAKGWLATDTELGTATFYMKNDEARPGQTYELSGNADGTIVRLAEVELDERGRGSATFKIDRPLTEYRVVRVKEKTAAVASGKLALWAHIDGMSDLRQDQPDEPQP